MVIGRIGKSRGIGVFGGGGIPIIEIGNGGQKGKIRMNIVLRHPDTETPMSGGEAGGVYEAEVGMGKCCHG